MTHKVTLTINGEKQQAEVEPRLLLVHFIRENCNLTGTHIGCDTTSCGACTVLINGTPAKSCTLLTVMVDGAEITTVEGLEQNGQLDAYPARLLRGAWLAVRLLHSRHDAGRQGAAGEEPRPNRD